MILGAGQLGVPGDHSWCMQAAANFITAGFLSQVALRGVTVDAFALGTWGETQV